MKLIVGLGNPGRKYEQTRHNVGFMAAAKVAALISAGPDKTRFEGQFAEGMAGESGSTVKLMLLCPHTYMNASGQSVRQAVDFYKLEVDDLLVVCDDLNLASGRLRIRPRGSAGGQNGLKDIIRHLGTEVFCRLKIGIGRPPQGWDVSDYVLGKFPKVEQDKIETATTQAAYAAIDWATKGINVAMNKYNADPDAEKAKQKAKSARNRTAKKKSIDEKNSDQNKTDNETTDQPSDTPADQTDGETN